MEKKEESYLGLAMADEYEKQQLVAIERWVVQEPSRASQIFSTATKPLSWVLVGLLPDRLLAKSIKLFDTLADKISDRDGALRKAGAKNMAELQKRELKLCDKFANKVGKISIGMAAAEGAISGSAGLITVPLDVASLIATSLMTIRDTGLCYGYDLQGEAGRVIAFGVLAISCAEGQGERLSAIKELERMEQGLAEEEHEEKTKNMARDYYKKGGRQVLFKKIVSKVAVRLSHRKALQFMPILGAVTGMGINAIFLRDVGRSAKYVFQSKWLINNNRL